MPARSSAIAVPMPEKPAPTTATSVVSMHRIIWVRACAVGCAAVKLPPLLHERSMNAEMALLVIGPIVLGALAGFLLGTSKGGYLIVSLIAALGGFGAGLEHDGWRSGFYRGLLGGLLYGTALLVVFDLREKAAKASLPDHESLIVVIAA